MCSFDPLPCSGAPHIGRGVSAINTASSSSVSSTSPVCVCVCVCVCVRMCVRVSVPGHVPVRVLCVRTITNPLAKALLSLGFEVKSRNLRSGLHAISLSAGQLSGGADHRREGIAIGD